MVGSKSKFTANYKTTEHLKNPGIKKFVGNHGGGDAGEFMNMINEGGRAIPLCGYLKPPST